MAVQSLEAISDVRVLSADELAARLRGLAKNGTTISIRFIS